MTFEAILISLLLLEALAIYGRVIYEVTPAHSISHRLGKRATAEKRGFMQGLGIIPGRSWQSRMHEDHDDGFAWRGMELTCAEVTSHAFVVSK